MLKYGVIATVMVFLALAFPQRAMAEYAIMGIGAAETCGKFAELYRQSPRLAETVHFSWAQGFMSGLNFEALAINLPTRDLNAISPDKQEADIRQYCNKHPLADYLDAVIALYKSLPEGRKDH